MSSTVSPSTFHAMQTAPGTYVVPTPLLPNIHSPGGQDPGKATSHSIPGVMPFMIYVSTYSMS